MGNEVDFSSSLGKGKAGWAPTERGPVFCGARTFRDDDRRQLTQSRPPPSRQSTNAKRDQIGRRRGDSGHGVARLACGAGLVPGGKVPIPRWIACAGLALRKAVREKCVTKLSQLRRREVQEIGLSRFTSSREQASSEDDTPETANQLELFADTLYLTCRGASAPLACRFVFGAACSEMETVAFLRWFPSSRPREISLWFLSTSASSSDGLDGKTTSTPWAVRRRKEGT